MTAYLPNNFRDCAALNPCFREGVLFRCAQFSTCPTPADLAAFLQLYGIQTVIDLRADREQARLPYTAVARASFRYVRVPFDPWTQSAEFQGRFGGRTNVATAYQFFLRECNESICKVAATLCAPSGLPAALHCHAGKDRTGIVVALLAFLIESPRAIVLADYLESKQDTTETMFEWIEAVVAESGGIKLYLAACGLTTLQIQTLSERLCKPSAKP